MLRGQDEVFAQYRTAVYAYILPSWGLSAAAYPRTWGATRHEPGPPMTLGNMRELSCPIEG